MAIDSSSPNHPPAPVAAALSPPWSQIVASAAPHSSSSPPPSTVVVDTPSVTVAMEDINNNSGVNNGNVGERIVWNKPSNAASSVIDPESWPALSESAKAPAKSPPPPQELGETSLGASTLPRFQGTGSMLPFQRDPVRDTANMNNRPPMPIHRRVKDTANMNSRPPMPIQQRPYRRPNPNLIPNGVHPPQFYAPQGSVAVPPGSQNHNSAPNYYPPRGGYVHNDQPQHRNSFKYRSGGGQYQHGDGFHHQNYGNRRDQVRGNQDWNAHQRNVNSRDNYRSPRFVPPFVPPPPTNTQYYVPPPTNTQYYVPPPTNTLYYVPPPPVWSFGGSYGYHERPQVVYSPSMPVEPLRGVPFVPSIPLNAVPYQHVDSKLYTKIVNQIDYYFSDQNLINDVYLKGIMDDQGWVPLNLIAGFKLVAHLTDNIQIVSDAVQSSSVVEMQGDKIRRQHGWWKWITPSTQSENITGSEAVGDLANRVQNIDLETTENLDHSASAEN